MTHFPKNWTFHHLGLPTDEKKEGEELHEMIGYKFYATKFGANPYRVQWLRYPEDHGCPEIIVKLPHLAFKVEDLDKEIEGKKIVFGPHEPIKGYRVVMIEDHGLPIELIETNIDDETLAEMEG